MKDIASIKKKTVKPLQKARVKRASNSSKVFPIVAIGASSGGLEAVTELFKYLPPDTGMAFIFIQHLSPDYKSILASLLGKTTKMPVHLIEGRVKMEPNNVYVIPNDRGIVVTDGHIQSIPRAKNSTLNLTVDVLFTSLAETHKEHAIGVVLSGNASDGTMGLKAIKQEGGITFAQDSSAKYNSMPDSAIDEGAADFVLSPKEIAQELTRISKHTFTKKDVLKAGRESKIDDNNPALKTILDLLNEASGVDFTQYKTGTIKRRILRRMFLYRLSTLAQYIKLLQTKSDEVVVLYNDLLINVTDFFRDKETFRYLKSTLLPKLIKNKKPGEPLRIWVAACSTGQEAYSMAMLLIEILGTKFSGRHIQIFASDLSEPAIKKARKGEYSAYEVKSVSAKRLERFFTKTGNNYQVSKAVRDLCVFAPHNILSDPPFSKVDFISCCNLLIYLDTDMHKKVLSTFHYALNDGGNLMLSKSESIDSTQMFLQLNKAVKIYTRKRSVHTLPVLSAGSRATGVAKSASKSYSKVIEPAQPQPAAEATINSILFSRFMPAYVIINYNRDILQFKGNTFPYLEHATGKATLNINSMARPEIAFELRDAINKAIETKREVNKTGIDVKTGARQFNITIDVIPVKLTGEDPLLLIVFTEQDMVPLREFKDGTNIPDATKLRINKLKEELLTSRAELISVTADRETSDRKLQEAKEEILSTNEEFHSMNEEMETSKEEIESANQELITTNQQLQTRNEQLAEANDFSEAIVATLHEPLLILDKNMRIKSSNKAFYKKFKVLQSAVDGKLLYELGNHQWNIPQLRELLENIIKRDTYFYDYEITHEFPEIGKKTMLLNAMRVVQQVDNEQLILLAFTDTTEKNRERKEEKTELEGIITERTKALELSYTQLEEKNVNLEKMNKELETFTFISSHDLQEPLRKIKGFASSLLSEEQQNLSATGKDYLARMQETVKRMHMLIEDLLAYSQVNNASQRFEKTDLNKIADEVIADFDDTIKEKKAIITSGGLCNVNASRFQLRQLLHNLISNSLKFADDKRPLRITIKSEIALSGKMDNPHLLPDTHYCHFSVSDNGIGFDPRYKNRIFEVFQRLHEYDKYKGTGMGLAICKRIVENHKGFITATGIVNKGTQFDIYIPAA